jgi:hypothetical protein
MDPVGCSWSIRVGGGAVTPNPSRHTRTSLDPMGVGGVTKKEHEGASVGKHHCRSHSEPHPYVDLDIAGRRGGVRWVVDRREGWPQGGAMEAGREREKGRGEMRQASRGVGGRKP